MVPTGVPGILVRNSSLMLTELLKGGAVPEHFVENRTVSIPKTSVIDDNGRIIRSPDALRPLTFSIAIANFLLLPSVEAFIGTP